MAKSFTHLDATERRLIALWKIRGLKLPYMAELLDRDKGTISRHVKKLTKKLKRQGRPPMVTDKTVEHLLKVRGKLVAKADCRYDVAVKMLRAAAGVKACERTILNCTCKCCLPGPVERCP